MVQDRTRSALLLADRFHARHGGVYLNYHNFLDCEYFHSTGEFSGKRRSHGMYNIGAQWHAIILKCSTSLDHFLETNKRNQSACEFIGRSKKKIQHGSCYLHMS